MRSQSQPPPVNADRRRGRVLSLTALAAVALCAVAAAPASALPGSASCSDASLVAVVPEIEPPLGAPIPRPSCRVAVECASASGCDLVGRGVFTATAGIVGGELGVFARGEGGTRGCVVDPPAPPTCEVREVVPGVAAGERGSAFCEWGLPTFTAWPWHTLGEFGVRTTVTCQATMQPR